MKLKLRIIWESRTFRVILAVLSVLLISTAIILPSVLTARKEGELIAFNRDVTSGTREAFVENALNLDPEEFSPGSNVLEASNNESMIKSTSRNKYSVGYASFGTVASFGENDEDSPIVHSNLSKNIGIASINGVAPTKANIKNKTYAPSREFNTFFRVSKDSEESKILDWQNNDVSGLSENLKASYAFYYWLLHSATAATLIQDGSEIEVDTQTEDITFDDLEVYAEKTKMDTSHKRIEIVGSSSASAVIHFVTKEFEDAINERYGSNTLEFVIATNGSADAFKKTVPGITESYIGLQSRGAKESELANWGYTTTDSQEIYNPFAIDAILIIYNKTGKLIEDKDKMYNTTQELLAELYSSNDKMSFEEVFS